MDRTIIHESWMEVIGEELEKPYFKELEQFLENERSTYEVYPPPKDVFTAFKYPLSNVKVCIVGQDCYHTPKLAHGLAFSVKCDRPPPSLRNIYKELEADPNVNFSRPWHGNLEYWAKQGVFLLNSVLTVRKGEAGSHRNKGWEVFTNAIINALNNTFSGIVYLLWGRDAQKKARLIDLGNNYVLEAGHPSPLSARFFLGCGHFGRTNSILEEIGESVIDWQLPSEP